MSGQKTIAVMKTKRRTMVVDLHPRYWAIGVAFGKRNYHVQLGPLALSLTKRLK